MSINRSSKRPNIILFNPDQWRGDVLGHLGNPAAVTPRLDQLVEQDAVSFRNAFCQNPVCTPSRCSFMTGWYPHVRGHRTMYHMLRPDEPMLLKRLKDAGYFVWWGGKNDVVPAENGYEAYCDVKYKPDRVPDPETNLHANLTGWRGDPGSDTYYSFFVGCTSENCANGDANDYYDSDWANVLGAIDFVRDAPTDQPFCIYLPLGYPHPPYGVEEPWFSAIRRELLPPRVPAPQIWSGLPSLLKGIWERQGMQSWTEERWTELRATYYGMCARVDHQFGLLVDALKEQNLYDDTAIIFFSDHGDFTGDYGLVEKTQNTFEDCLTHVPFIIKPPKGTPVQPRVTDALVELVDISATVEELAQLEKTYSHFGRSLLPVVSGGTDKHRDAVFCEGGRLHGELHCTEMESHQHQPDGLYSPRLILQQSEGPEHTKAVMCRTDRYKYVMRLYEKDELYDLQEDPSELRNRVDDPLMAPIVLSLRDRLLRFFLETSDVVPWDANSRG